MEIIADSWEQVPKDIAELHRLFFDWKHILMFVCKQKTKSSAKILNFKRLEPIDNILTLVSGMLVPLTNKSLTQRTLQEYITYSTTLGECAPLAGFAIDVKQEIESQLKEFERFFNETQLWQNFRRDYDSLMFNMFDLSVDQEISKLEKSASTKEVESFRLPLSVPQMKILCKCSSSKLFRNFWSEYVSQLYIII